MTTQGKKKRGNNEGSITKRSDGRYMARVTLPDGTRRTFYGTTRKEAADKLAVALRDLQRGIAPPKGAQTVEKFLADWIANVVTPSVRPRTLGSYKWAVGHITTHLGKTKLAALSAQQIQAMLTRLGDALSPQSVKHVHTVLGTALGVAVEWDLLGFNPAERVKAPRVPRVDRRTLSAEQGRKFLASVKGDRFEGVYLVALTTGMRLGEVLGLRWQDLDLDQGLVHVQVQLSYRTKDWSLVEPKSKRSRRTIRLLEGTVAVLKEHRRRQLEERLASPEWTDYGLVFTTSRGTPVSPTNMTRRYLKEALASAELPDMPFHGLRRTVITLLNEQGMHPENVRDLVGHSTTALVLETYNQMAPGSGQAAVKELGRLLGA